MGHLAPPLCTTGPWCKPWLLSFRDGLGTGRTLQTHGWLCREQRSPPGEVSLSAAGTSLSWSQQRSRQMAPEGPAPAPRWAGAPRASRSPLALPTRPTLHPQENDTICLGCLLQSLRLGAGGVLLSACVVAGSEPRGSSLLHPRSAGTVPEPKPAPSRWHSRLVATAHVPAWKQRENRGDCRVPGLRDRCPSQRCVQGTPVTGWESPGAQGSAWDCSDSRVHAPAAAVAPTTPVQETP